MDWLASFLGKILYALWRLFQKDIKEGQQDQKTVEEEGKRAEEASKGAISDLERPEKKSPINKHQEVPSVSKWKNFLKHRRNRKRL